MLDVDHFKQINDRYGHVAGDDVLREVAAVIRESTRAEDLVARYGGEEFVIALPVSLASLAVRRAERIRVELAARTIAAGSRLVRLTASVGLSFNPPGWPRNERRTHRRGGSVPLRGQSGGAKPRCLRASTRSERHTEDGVVDSGRDAPGVGSVDVVVV